MHSLCVPAQPSPALPQIRAHSKYSSVSLCLCAGLHSARGRNCSSRTFNTRGGAAMTRSGWCGYEKWHNSLYPYCLSFSLVLLILRAKRDSKLPEFYPCPMFQTKKESLFDTPSMTRAGAGPCDSPKQGLTSKRAIWLWSYSVLCPGWARPLLLHRVSPLQRDLELPCCCQLVFELSSLKCHVPACWPADADGLTLRE